MHEFSVAASIYQACREAVAGHGPGRIDRVRVRVGELSAVEPDLIVFAWQAVTVETPDQGSTLEVEWCPALQECATCGEVKQRVDRSWLPLCPDCGEVLKVTAGTDLEVVELTYETEDSGEEP